MPHMSRPYDPDDIAVWPNGTWATLADIRAGEFNHMSDDYEIVPHDDVERLRALGLSDLLDSG